MARGNAPSTTATLLSDAYDGSAYSAQLPASANDPYHPTLAYSESSLPAGYGLDASGRLTVEAGITLPVEGQEIVVTATNGLRRSASLTYLLTTPNAPLAIVKRGETRHYADGTYAQSCAAYTKPAGRYAYVGSTGDGTYRIDPDGPAGTVAPTDVTCTGMDTSTPATVVAALVTGSNEYSYGFHVKNWVLEDKQDLYLALADIHSSMRFSGRLQITNKQWGSLNALDGTGLVTMQQYEQRGFTFGLSKGRPSAFWTTTIYLDCFPCSAGPSLTIDSPNVTFQ
ncbi:hypothetical protein BHAOGJBA_4497 [Methylobacterium hispanicum]|uniref:Uncharacterized protein n=1 Tax=Methylobacterium hispanicum TaxID=270350 RepID=A0AAV4ZRR1_9HYPH|nr:hypothetical protein [Methylobacterium hispanicum]GJD90953.1 hypothetical protein BHAOGJBA_4497 [Methylobacterium hispanicum]